MNGITRWYATLSQREQRLVLAGAIIAAALVVLGIFLPLDGNLSRASTRVARKQADLAWMQAAAPALAAAGPAAATAPAAPGSLILLATSSANEAGLKLTSTEPTSQGGLRVRLDHVSFDGVVTWLYRMSQQNGIRVETATIDAAGNGTVNAGIVLRTAG